MFHISYFWNFIYSMQYLGHESGQFVRALKNIYIGAQWGSCDLEGQGFDFRLRVCVWLSFGYTRFLQQSKDMG